MLRQRKSKNRLYGTFGKRSIQTSKYLERSGFFLRRYRKWEMSMVNGSIQLIVQDREPWYRFFDRRCVVYMPDRIRYDSQHMCF